MNIENSQLIPITAKKSEFVLNSDERNQVIRDWLDNSLDIEISDTLHDEHKKVIDGFIHRHGGSAGIAKVREKHNSYTNSIKSNQKTIEQVQLLQRLGLHDCVFIDNSVKVMRVVNGYMYITPSGVAIVNDKEIGNMATTARHEILTAEHGLIYNIRNG